MKKIVILLFSLSFLLNFTACTSENSSSAEDISSPENEIIEALPFPDIKLSIPSDYETTSSNYIDEFYKKGNASVIVTSKKISDSQKDMDSIVYDALYQYNEIADNLTEVSNEIFEINGCEARIAEIRYSIMGETDTLSMSCCFGFIIGENSLYIITCSVPTDEYSNYSDEFKEIIQSAKPTD